MALYDATGGSAWTRATNWLSDEPLEEWYGVSTGDGGRVTSLVLSANGLSGKIPSKLGDPRWPSGPEPQRQPANPVGYRASWAASSSCKGCASTTTGLAG